MNADWNLNNDHNVYILGAGFSRDAGMPLISDFLNEMRNSHEWLEHQERFVEADAIREVLQFRLQSASAAYRFNLNLENIEELFSLASAAKGEMDKKIRLAIAATLDYCRARHEPRDVRLTLNTNSKLFQLAPANGSPKYPHWAPPVERLPVCYNPGQYSDVGPFKVPLYTFYLARLLGMFVTGAPKGKNAVVTLNYDTVVEDALKSLKLNFDYGLAAKPDSKSKGAIQLLKLHGSVNWTRTPATALLPESIRVYDSYDQLRVDQHVPALIPPTWKKVFGGEIEGVWDKAVQVLTSATRIVIIGSSIPPTDLHFKYLLAAGLQSNVSLRKIIFVNPVDDGDKTEFEQRVRKLFRAEDQKTSVVTFSFSTLEWFTRPSRGNETKFDLLNRPLEERVTYGF